MIVTPAALFAETIPLNLCRRPHPPRFLRTLASSHSDPPASKRSDRADTGRSRFSSARRRSPAPDPHLEIPVVRVQRNQSAAFFSANSWERCGADESMVSALASIGITRPSHIQAAAFRAIVSDAPHVVVADHAGSGKTLAYLVPLIQILKSEEKSASGPPVWVPRCPRYIIVAPTAELCTQVLRVSRALSSTLRFRTVAVTGGRPIRTQREALEGGVDVVVGTPGRLAELLTSGSLSLERCAAIVYDEVDVLLGYSSMFAEQVAPLRGALPSTARNILVTATLPADVHARLEPDFPGLVAVLGPGLHRTAPGVLEQIVDCSGGDEISEESGSQRKRAALFAALQERKAKRTIVFCNKIETCRVVENFLNRTMPNEEKVVVLAHHAAVAPETREAKLQRFLIAPEDSSQQRLILVCTDRASRGVDSAFVDHVVLFDFPRDPSEYLRRVGRTGRGASGQGVVTVLVLGRQVKLANDVIGRNQSGLPVHALPAVMPVSNPRMASEEV